MQPTSEAGPRLAGNAFIGAGQRAIADALSASSLANVAKAERRFATFMSQRQATTGEPREVSSATSEIVLDFLHHVCNMKTGLVVEEGA